MVMQDYDREFSMFKYLGMLTNPDGYKMIEEAQNPKSVEEITIGQRFEDGEQASKFIQEENEKYGIKRPTEEQSDEAIIIE